MGNHNDCPYCGMCDRCEGCTRDCPGAAYERALNKWRDQQADHVSWETADQRKALRQAEQAAAEKYAKDNPPPPEPKRVR